MDDASALARFPGGYWDVPAFLKYVQPVLTDGAVEAAEAQLGVKLPALYLALLRQQNGGYLRTSSGLSRVMSGIGPQFPSITRDQAWWRPANADIDWAPVGAALLIPFDGDGHWNACFDYRDCGPRGEPSITYVDCESEYEEPLAACLADFLADSVDQYADATLVGGDTNAEALSLQLAAQLGLEAPTVDDFDHGFPVWRLALRGETQWCWCSPNRVPRGFRREGSRVVTTQETALRVPEHPTCQVILECTDDSTSTIAAALAAMGLDVISAPPR